MRRAIHRMEQDIIRLEQEVYRLNKILSIVKKLGLFTQEKDDRLFVYFKNGVTLDKDDFEFFVDNIDLTTKTLWGGNYSNEK